MKSTKRRAVAARKRARKGEEYKKGGKESKYARKTKWLARAGVWGFQVPEPKPWRGSAA